jgi:hypothetical protein
MAANEFRQRRGVAVRTYRLTDSAVIVRHRGVLRHTEIIIPYHGLSDERFSTTVYSRVALGVAIFAAFFALMMFIARSSGDDVGAAAEWFYVGIAALSGAAFLNSWIAWTGILGSGYSLELWAGKPSTEDVDAFLNELLMRRASYLYRLRYPTPSSVAEELEKLVILRNRGDITAEEFERLKARVIDPGEAPADDTPNKPS